jgi:hypothetical protein
MSDPSPRRGARSGHQRTNAHRPRVRSELSRFSSRRAGRRGPRSVVPPASPAPKAKEHTVKDDDSTAADAGAANAETARREADRLFAAARRASSQADPDPRAASSCRRSSRRRSGTSSERDEMNSRQPARPDRQLPDRGRVAHVQRERRDVARDGLALRRRPGLLDQRGRPDHEVEAEVPRSCASSRRSSPS